MKTFELRLIPYDLHAAIKAAAFREGVSMNTWILKAVRKEVDGDSEVIELLTDLKVARLDHLDPLTFYDAMDRPIEKAARLLGKLRRD